LLLVFLGLMEPAWAHYAPEIPSDGIPLKRTEAPTYAQSQWAFGAGVMWFQGFEGAEGNEAIPIVSFEFRHATPISEFIALDQVFIIGLHDFKTIGNIYQWAFEGDKEDLAIKLGTGWMVFWAPPLAGANYTFCQGITYYSSEQTPNFQISAGMSASLLLRFSNPDFKWDVGFGPYLAFGTEFANGFGLNMRALYTYPVYRMFVADESINVISVTGNMVFPF